MNISRKLFIANVMIVLVATITTSAVSLYVTRKEITRQVSGALTSRIQAFHQLLDQKGRSIRIIDGKLQMDGVMLDGNNGPCDKMKEIFGGEATIYN